MSEEAKAENKNPVPEDKPVIAGDKMKMNKGEEVVLSKEEGALRQVTVGLGWKAPEQKEGFPVDIDASAFMLNREGRVRRDPDFIFYNNLEGDKGCIVHLGDNTTGEDKSEAPKAPGGISGIAGNSMSGGGAPQPPMQVPAGDDKEVICITLGNVPFDVERIAFSVTIHNAQERQQTFGLVQDAYMRIVNAETNEELAHYDLTEDASDDNGMIFGELVREGMGWKFKALGTGTTGGLFRIARDYGVNVAPM